MKTLKDTLDEASAYLLRNKIDNSDLDAWYLLSHVLGINRAQYFLTYHNKMDEALYKEYMNLIKKRADHTPLQYILGYQEFMGLNFIVNEKVLIPRQDTEILVEEVGKVCTNKDVLDLCTGSGCIIISLAKLGNINRGVGVDISHDALELAKENAYNNEVDIEWIQSDLFTRVEGKFDIIVSNPPYIPTKEIQKLSLEVKDYEPSLALDGKEDGLFFYKKIIKDIKNYLKKDGYLFLEIGYNQGQDLINLIEKEGFRDIKVIKDYASLDRVITGRYDSK